MKASILMAGFTAALSAASISNASVVDLTAGLYTETVDANDHCDGYGCLLFASGDFLYTAGATANSGGNLLMTDDYGVSRTELWRSDGKRFNVEGLSAYVVNRWQVTGPLAFSFPDPDMKDPYDPGYMEWLVAGEKPDVSSLSVLAYRDGVVVGEKAFGTSHDDYVFGEGFKNIDYLEFNLGLLTYPTYVFDFRELTELPANTLWCYEWCYDAGAGSLTYSLTPTLPAAVPLPPAGLALAAALMGMMALARRKGFQA